MSIAKAAGALFAIALTFAPFGAARAELLGEPVQGSIGERTADPNLVVTKGQGQQATNAITTIYDNTTAPAAVSYGVSSTDLAAVWGGEVFTTGTGLLSTHKFAIFNSDASAGGLTSATVAVSFYDAVSAALLGS